MDFNLEFEEGRNIISGSIIGELTKDRAKAYFSKLSQMAHQKACQRLLTDVRRAELSGTAKDIQILSKELSGIGFKPSFKRAILLHADVAGYKVWENYCLMAGFKNVKLFVDSDLAKEWLLAE